MPEQTSRPLTSVWLRPARTPRARRGQAFTRDDLAATAVGLADRDGIDALSMRRVAAELGITAMSLYWYVDTKEQLIELMVDRVFAEQEPPAGDDWRARLAAIGRATFARYRSHPWFVQALGRPGSLPGPGQLRYWNTNVGALTDPALVPRLASGDVTVAVGTVNHFVSGFALSPLPGVLVPYGGHPEVERYLRDEVAGQGLDQLRGMGGSGHRFTEDRFDRELDIILEGLRVALVEPT
jgi:AcrR family transcriptional regulator